MNKNCSYDSVNKIWSGKTSKQLYNTDENIGYTILQRLIQHPTRVFQISDDTGVELTNAEVYKRSLKFANHLTNLGVKQHDIVGLIAMNSENVTSLLFACYIIGAAVHPLSVLMNEDDMSYQWSKTHPKVVFSDANITSVVKNAVSQMKITTEIYTLIDRVDGHPFADDILLESYDADDFDFPDLPNISSTIALIMCSSGTTGLPKAVSKSHEQLQTAYYPFFKRDPSIEDVAFISFSSYWITYHSMLIMCVLFGFKLVVTAVSCTPDLWIDIVDRHKVTIVMNAPVVLTLVKKSSKIQKFESMRALILTGCTVSEKFIFDVKQLIPNGQIYFIYGSTELNMMAHTTFDGPKGTSTGFPARNFKMKIKDESGQSLGSNEKGEIYIKAPVQFSGYFGDPQTTAESLDSENYLKTGDVGYFDDEGHLYVLDRIKNLIKTKEQYRVTPTEIETVVDEIDGVLQSCVVGVEDKEKFYDFIYAFVIKNKIKPELTEEYIVNYVNDRVIETKKISCVFFVEKMPMTPTGKVQNVKLREIARKFHEEMS